MDNMREYRPGNSYKYLTFFIFVLFWIYGALLISIPIYYFIKDGTIIGDSPSSIISSVIIYGILIGVTLYRNYRIYRIRASIDSKQIIYINHKSMKTIHFKDINKLKLITFGNGSSIKLFTQTQKIKIHLVFKDAYEFLLDIKKGLDDAEKSEVYSHKKLFKFIRMVLNAEIMQEWGTKLISMMMIGFLLLFAMISITTFTEEKMFLAFSSCIIIMLGIFITIFIIQNRYKRESNEDSFLFPKRDIEFEKRIMKKGYILNGLFFAVIIIIILII